MLLKIKEVAERFQVTPRTVRQEIKNGNLPAIKIGRVWRVRADTLTVYLQENETTNEPQLGGLSGREREGRTTETETAQAAPEETI